MNYLFHIVEDLYRYDVGSSPIENGRRIASVVTTICCFRRLMSDGITINVEHSSAVLSMLYLMPDIMSQKCVDWDYLIELIPTSFREEAYLSIREVTKLLMNAKYLAEPQWLFALPILHFLKGVSRPFQETEFYPQAIEWNDKLVGLGKVKSYTCDSEHG